MKPKQKWTIPPFFPARKASEHREILSLRLLQVREHACWLWSRLGVSLMTLEDRNVWLEEENKRLEQERRAPGNFEWADP